MGRGEPPTPRRVRAAHGIAPKKGGPPITRNLFAELRRRNVFRVAGVYAVAGWLLLAALVAVAAGRVFPLI